MDTLEDIPGRAQLIELLKSDDSPGVALVDLKDRGCLYVKLSDDGTDLVEAR